MSGDNKDNLNKNNSANIVPQENSAQPAPHGTAPQSAPERPASPSATPQNAANRLAPPAGAMPQGAAERPAPPGAAPQNAAIRPAPPPGVMPQGTAERPIPPGTAPQNPANRPTPPPGVMPQGTAERPAPPGAMPQGAVKKPLPPGAKPQSVAKKPLPPGAKPQSAAKKPLPPGAKPQSAAKKPLPPGARPQSAAKKPLPPGSKPISVAKKPAASRISPQTTKKAAAARASDANIGDTKSSDISLDLLVANAANPYKHPDALDSDFEIDFDFDSVCRDVPTDSPIRVRRDKRTGIAGGLLYAVFILSIGIILGSMAWMAAADVLGFDEEAELISVTVPPDFELEDIIELLFDAGLIRFRFLFRLYAEHSNAVDKISPGSYLLCRSFDYRALVYGMTRRIGIRQERDVTIPEGFNLSQIFARLDYHGITDADALWHAATYHDFNFPFLDSSTLGDRHRLEGFLFPDTYSFFVESTPVEAISRMLRQFNRVFDEDMVDRAEEMGFTVHEIVILASMIEREAGDDEERPRISAVIHNRLNYWDHPILQIDATLFYATAALGVPFSYDMDSPFNTYIHPGLPPGAIASPGMASLRAALFPATTDEFFYALNLYGTHNFFATYAQHRAFVESDQFGG